MERVRRVWSAFMVAVMLFTQYGSTASAEGIVWNNNKAAITEDVSAGELQADCNCGESCVHNCSDVSGCDCKEENEDEVIVKDIDGNDVSGDDEVVEEEEERIGATIHIYGVAFDWDWTDTWGEACGHCDECDTDYIVDGCDNRDDAEDKLSEFFCEDCGLCGSNGNTDCFEKHHCNVCYKCLDPGDLTEYCEHCSIDGIVCYDCTGKYDREEHCQYCGQHYGEDTEECDCEWSLIERHCIDCKETVCISCGVCLEVAGEPTGFADEGCDACMEHSICCACMESYAQDDGFHCRECYHCDQDICPECGLCEDCAEDEEHCPECGTCFGEGGIQWCEHGGEGEHCIGCCEENGWICEQCGECCEGSGKEMCDDCNLCWECCLENSEDTGCTHGYCILSSDFEDHLCPGCGQCPDDNECEDCGLCEECAENYHCDHGLCPDGFDWDEHVCPDCGDCFELDELCEWCGLCENCRSEYHCQHDLCPEDWEYDMSEHFFCEQCGECFENIANKERCETCELCLKCCLENTRAKGCDCDDNYCIKSDDFAKHWCFADDQCLSKCNHNKGCTHLHKSTAWSLDDSGHWHICEDCGASVDMDAHTEATPEVIIEPDPVKRKEGVAKVYCADCGCDIARISIPFVEIPEDGSPYILSEPRDYTGKVTGGGKIYYAVYTVRAGGEGKLTYQWYEKDGLPVSDFSENGIDYITGSKTNTLRVPVNSRSCHDPAEYYCVVTNEKGSTQTRNAVERAQHWYRDSYEPTGFGYHKIVCVGNGCGKVKESLVPCRYDKWIMEKEPTAIEEGKKYQKCLDCGYKKVVTIPKLSAEHQHSTSIKSNAAFHWRECECGWIEHSGMLEHKWDQGTVKTAATEKKKGEMVYECMVCHYKKTESIDKLTHTHDWYYYDGKSDHCGGENCSKGHFVRCKGCDQVKWIEHEFADWNIVSSEKATAGKPYGRVYRTCETCGYKEFQHYEYGQYRVWVNYSVATVEPAFARPGETVTVRPKKLENVCWGDSTWGDLSGSSSYTDLDLVAIPGFDSIKMNEVLTFKMPSGNVAIERYAGSNEKTTCKHKVTEQGERVEPSCTGYGHEPDVLCKTCGKVIKEGNRIEPLGHDLNETPDPGTAVDEYCHMITSAGVKKARDKKSYEGDFTCKRCNKTMKGKYKPAKHGCYDPSGYWGKGKGYVEQSTSLKDREPATCTKNGYSGDWYCNYCKQLFDRGHKVEKTGHDWDEWEVVEESTSKKHGYKIRKCVNDDEHVERETLPLAKDLTLEADKTRVRFDFAYGHNPEPAIITFTSVGSEKISSITKVYADGAEDYYNLSICGPMSVRVEPKPDYHVELMEEEETNLTLTVAGVKEGESGDKIFAPAILVSSNVRKSNEKYNLTVDTGYIKSINGLSTGGMISTDQLRAGDCVTIKPVKEDKSLVSWEIVSDISKELLGYFYNDAFPNRDYTFYMPGNDVSIKGIYKSDVCTFTYRPNSVYHSVSKTIVKKGSYVDEWVMEYESYSGKKFRGWYTDTSYTQLFDFAQPIYSDTTVYGMWQDPQHYTVSFNMKGHGTKPDDQRILRGEKALMPATPDDPGYKFGGWYTDSALTMPFSFESKIYSDKTLYAKWVKNKVTLYTVTFDLGSEGYMGAETVEKGKKLKKPADPIAANRKFLIFAGWYTDAEFTKKYDFNKAVKSDLVLFAKWNNKDTTDPQGMSLSFASGSGVTFNPGCSRYEATYTGKAIKPKVEVSYNYDGRILKEGVDYTLKYSNNKNVDKKGKAATVTVTGKGNFKGSKKISFYILPKSLGEYDPVMDKYVTAADIDGYIPYIQSGKKPSPTVIYNGYRLTSNDYSMSSEDYPNLKFKADGQILLKGKGNFSGRMVLDVYASADTKLVKQYTMKLDFVKNSGAGSSTYGTGEPVTLLDSQVTVKTAGGEVIPSDKYDLVYENNVNAGTAKVTAIGKGEYSGYISNTKTFKIKPNTKAAMTVKIVDTDLSYDPAGVKPKVVVTGDHSGIQRELTEGKDYTLSWTNNKKANKKAYCTVNFKGNYKGHKAVKSAYFTIKPLKLDADRMRVTASDKIYSKAGSYISSPFVTYDGRLLLNGTDYTVKYFVGDKDITKAKKYSQEEEKVFVTLKITGKGNYSGKTVEFSNCYMIRKSPADCVDLSKIKITKQGDIKKTVPNQGYTGSAVTPAFDIYVKVKDGKKEKWVPIAETGLKSGVDYEIIYINNVKRGTATIMVKAKQTSSKAVKSKTANFTIGQKNLSILKWFQN